MVSYAACHFSHTLSYPIVPLLINMRSAGISPICTLFLIFFWQMFHSCAFCALCLPLGGAYYASWPVFLQNRRQRLRLPSRWVFLTEMRQASSVYQILALVSNNYPLYKSLNNVVTNLMDVITRVCKRSGMGSESIMDRLETVC